MKAFISTLFLALVFSSCQKNSEKKTNSSKKETTEIKNTTDRDKSALRGEVKEVTEKFYYPKAGSDGIIPGEKIGETKYTYDESGNRSNTDSIKSKRVKVLYIPGWTHKYSHNGNITESTRLNDDGTIAEKYTYNYSRFDHHGNWREKYEYKNEAMVMITTREIIYF